MGGRDDRRDTDSEVLGRGANAVREGEPPTPTLDMKLSDLFQQHHGRVRAVCLRITGSEQQANELAQEALLTAWRKLPDWDGRSAFGTWVFGIARNLAFNAVRRKGELLADDGVIEAEDLFSLDALGSLQQAEREDLLREAAAAVLEPVEQEAVFLRYVEGMPQDRITEMLGLEARSGARGLLQRCRRKLGLEIRRRLHELGHGSSFVRDVSDK